MDVIVIGAGAVGSYVAGGLASKGYKVEQYDIQKTIGQMQHCTGLVTGAIWNVLKRDESLILNKIERFRLVCGNEELEVRQKDLVLDRKKLEEHLSEIAVSEGVKLALGRKFLNFKINGEVNVHFDKESKTSDYLIGADGVFSSVASCLGIKRDTVCGVQARIKKRIEDENLVEVNFDFGQFGWCVPESRNIARLGIIGDKETFNKFLKKHNGSVIEYTSGFIPMYNSQIKASNGRVFLVGDAAGHVKATSYGGLVLGLKGGQELVKSFDDYEKNWRRIIGKELWLSLKIREMLNKFKIEDCEKLLRLLKSEGCIRVLESYERDFPSKILIKLLLSEPRFLKFGRFLF